MSNARTMANLAQEKREFSVAREPILVHALLDHLTYPEIRPTYRQSAYLNS
jgi:hypothetical protein